MIDTVAASWLIVFIVLVYVFLKAWDKTDSVRAATIIMLLIGKLAAAIMAITGLDRTLTILQLRSGDLVRVSVAEAIFALFLVTIITVAVSALVLDALPSEIRRALDVEGSDK